MDGGRTLPIGVDSSLSFDAAEIPLAAGSSIVLFTDGLVESRDRTLDEGLRALAESASGATVDPQQLVDQLIDDLIGERERPDDVAILVLRLAPAAVGDLEVTVPSSRDGLTAMRRTLREWLSRGSVADTTHEAEIVLAVWEACANAVEHAQGPSLATFSLRGMFDDRGHVRIEVSDSGRWKAGDGSSDRGFGLRLMRSLMDSVDVTSTDAGTTVVMERQVDLRALV
jgi:anti-sigma regulatory factor (Ser/Thr protein kinase)